jgi:hypothetical protein
MKWRLWTSALTVQVQSGSDLFQCIIPILAFGGLGKPRWNSKWSLSWHSKWSHLNARQEYQLLIPDGLPYVQGSIKQVKCSMTRGSIYCFIWWSGKTAVKLSSEYCHGTPHRTCQYKVGTVWIQRCISKGCSYPPVCQINVEETFQLTLNIEAFRMVL